MEVCQAVRFARRNCGAKDFNASGRGFLLALIKLRNTFWDGFDLKKNTLTVVFLFFFKLDNVEYIFIFLCVKSIEPYIIYLGKTKIQFVSFSFGQV